MLFFLAKEMFYFINDVQILFYLFSKINIFSLQDAVFFLWNDVKVFVSEKKNVSSYVSESLASIRASITHNLLSFSNIEIASYDDDATR